MHFHPFRSKHFFWKLCIFYLFTAIVTWIDLYLICPQLPPELFEEHGHVGEN